MNKADKGNKGGKGKNFKGHWLAKNILMAALAVAATLFVTFSLLKVITRHNQELEVPSFINMGIQEAEHLARENDMRLEITDSVYINRMEPGAIFKQNPQAGSKVKKNRRIPLTINATKPKMVQMPSLVGFSLRQAQSELTANQLSVGKLIYVEDLATNNVLEQLYKGAPIPAGKEIPTESSIDLRLGLNKQEDSTTFIPQLKGVKYLNIKAVLVENSLNLAAAHFDATVTNYSDSLESQVYKQIPAYSDTLSIEMGAPVTLYFTRDKSLLEKNNK